MLHNIKYRQLKAFTLLAETGSFKGAADHLSVTQPSLSIMIKELEHDLGVSLVDRTTHSVALTDAGRDLFEQVRGSLEQLEGAYAYAKSAGEVRHGRLRIATLPTLAAGVAGPAIGEFHKDHPGVHIELIERTYVNFLAALRQHEVDLGIGILRASEPTLDFHPLFQDRLMVVAPRGHPVTRQDGSVRSLAGCQVVLVPAGPNEVLRLLEVDLSRSLQVEQPSTAISMVRNGVGVTITPSSALAAIDLRGLACMPIDSPHACRDIGIVVHKDRRPSPAASTFMRVLSALQAGAPAAAGRAPPAPAARKRAPGSRP